MTAFPFESFGIDVAVEIEPDPQDRGEFVHVVGYPQPNDKQDVAFLRMGGAEGRHLSLPEAREIRDALNVLIDQAETEAAK